MARRTIQGARYDGAEAVGILPEKVMPMGLTISQHVMTKFQEYRGVGVRATIEECLWKSRPCEVDNDLRFAVRVVLGIKNPDRLWLRLRENATNSLSLYFIGDGDRVIELVTWRGLRQFRKLAQKKFNEEFKGQPEAERYTETFKHKRPQKVGGGLLSQEKCPKDRFAKLKHKVFERVYEVPLKPPVQIQAKPIELTALEVLFEAMEASK